MKGLKPAVVQQKIKGRTLLSLAVIFAFLGMTSFGCESESSTPPNTQATPSPQATSPSPSPSPSPQTSPSKTASPTPKPTAATNTTKTPSPTPKPTATSTPTKPASPTPKPSPQTSPTKPTSSVNQNGQTPQSNLPKPNAQGFYQRNSHKLWQVVTTDPKGLGCRMGKYTIEQIQSPGGKVIFDIANWPVIGTFKSGQKFEIDLGPAGFGVVYDDKQQPWILVDKSFATGAPTKCFVPASSAAVKPISAI